MKQHELIEKSRNYLTHLCETIGERSVGSKGNIEATGFFRDELSALGWETRADEFEAIDWISGGAELSCDGENYKVLVSPYSLGFKGEAELVTASSIQELELLDTTGRILLLHGALAKEQLMPKNFVFYNPEEHQQIIALLESKSPLAIVCATGRNASLAGGVYPFPLIEDGDFDIPSVYMTEEEGQRLLRQTGRKVFLQSVSERVPGRGYNVLARINGDKAKKIVLTAHIDAKKGTPGAIDNATGVIVLLLVARLLNDYRGNHTIEIVALNGEDYYAVPGQMSYIRANQDQFGSMLININIDGAGYREGLSSYSLFELPDHLAAKACEVFGGFQGITEGIPWPQGDHSIFVQSGVPAIAISSKWFIDHIDSQEITHTPKDTPAIVDCSRLVEISQAIHKFVLSI